MFYRKKRKAPGEVFLLYVVLYSFARIFIEQMRMDYQLIGPFRVATVVSILLVVAGTIMIIINRKKVASGKLSLDMLPNSSYKLSDMKNDAKKTVNKKK